MNDRLLKLVKEEFERLLQEKTNWGRNQIMLTFEKAISNVTIRKLKEKETFINKLNSEL